MIILDGSVNFVVATSRDCFDKSKLGMHVEFVCLGEGANLDSPATFKRTITYNNHYLIILAIKKKIKDKKILMFD